MMFNFQLNIAVLCVLHFITHGMCYSHYGNGAISIAQWGLLSDCYKVNPNWPMRKNYGNHNGVCRYVGALLAL